MSWERPAEYWRRALLPKQVNVAGSEWKCELHEEVERGEEGSKPVSEGMLG